MLASHKPAPIWTYVGIGPPRCDENGIPIYKTWELVLDGTIHVLGLLWAVASTAVLLTTSTAPRFCVYSATTILMLSSSALFNLVGCGLRVWCEPLRRLDHASIFLGIGGTYTVFELDWRLLLVTWLVCGLCALLKISFGKRFEGLAMLFYVGLGIAPLVLLHPFCRAYPTVVGGVATMTLGFVFGYFNNEPGGTAFWHACVLASVVAGWTIVYGAALNGPNYYLVG